jgi:hypothetical protein
LEPSAVKWVASKKEAVPEMRFASGKIDMHSRRSVSLFTSHLIISIRKLRIIF